MNVLISVAEFFANYGWTIVALAFTGGYGAVLTLMVQKARRDRSLPDDQKPGPRPLFYLGQACLAFMWPIPLFLALEAIDFFAQTQ